MSREGARDDPGWKTKSEVPTPSLWVDLDCMERNIAALAAFFRSTGVSWRPHTKGIKVPAIAHKLLDAGAIGITCAKLGEAEVMAAAGVRDILVANQVVGPDKATRLAKLRHSSDVMVAVDSLENAREISDAAVDKRIRIRVLVEVNSGMNRCGIEPGEPTVHFACEVGQLPGITLAGVMAWEGHCAGIGDMEKKTACVHKAVGCLLRTAEMCRASGLEIPIVSCGGSGTYMVTAQMPGVTEIQAGGAVFMDVAYRNWGVLLENSLFVVATVTSRPAPTRAVVDAGRKAMNGEVAMPELVGIPGVKVISLSAEHGTLQLDSADIPLRVGQKVDFIVGYGDNTVYLHDHLYGVRRGEVEAVWDIQARGKLT